MLVRELIEELQKHSDTLVVLFQINIQGTTDSGEFWNAEAELDNFESIKREQPHYLVISLE